MNYLIQRENNNSTDLQKKFDEKSSLTLEKHILSLAFLRDTRVEIVASSEQIYLQDRLQPSNVVNIISSKIIQYKASGSKFNIESL